MKDSVTVELDRKEKNLEKQFRQGLKMRRKNRTRKPEYYCDNCKCYRYSPCNCMKKSTS